MLNVLSQVSLHDGACAGACAGAVPGFASPLCARANGLNTTNNTAHARPRKFIAKSTVFRPHRTSSIRHTAMLHDIAQCRSASRRTLPALSHRARARPVTRPGVEPLAATRHEILQGARLRPDLHLPRHLRPSRSQNHRPSHLHPAEIKARRSTLRPDALGPSAPNTPDTSALVFSIIDDACPSITPRRPETRRLRPRPRSSANSHATAPPPSPKAPASTQLRRSRSAAFITRQRYFRSPAPPQTAGTTPNSQPPPQTPATAFEHQHDTARTPARHHLRRQSLRMFANVTALHLQPAKSPATPPPPKTVSSASTSPPTSKTSPRPHVQPARDIRIPSPQLHFPRHPPPIETKSSPPPAPAVASSFICHPVSNPLLPSPVLLFVIPFVCHPFVCHPFVCHPAGICCCCCRCRCLFFFCLSSRRDPLLPLPLPVLLLVVPFVCHPARNLLLPLPVLLHQPTTARVPPLSRTLRKGGNVRRQSAFVCHSAPWPPKISAHQSCKTPLFPTPETIFREFPKQNPMSGPKTI